MTINRKGRKKAVCLFSSAGLGELGLKANDIDIVASNELLKDRHNLYQVNFPKTKCFDGDIWKVKDDIVDFYKKSCKEELFLLYATPPCQGMSTNGAGKLLDEVRRGNRKEIDERNRLIIPTLDVIKKLQPKWIIFENVPNMQNTIINDENDNFVNIMDYIKSELGEEYTGIGEVVACSDYGIPQQRKRLITIYTRDPEGIKYFKQNGSFFPEHEKGDEVTLRDAIGQLPSLDSSEGKNSAESFHPLHMVPIMKEDKYWWVSHTREGQTAYNNQCVNEKCMFDKNPLHKDVTAKERSKSNNKTAYNCLKCGSLLPRPSLIDKNTKERRLIKGFHSAYRRMKWDKPAHTITQNFQFEASDNKLHPEQNRVLSTYEALILQTIADYEYNFEVNGKVISRSFFSKIIGESVPPKLIDIICKKMIGLSTEGNKKFDLSETNRQMSLLA
ncbi:MAG: DNA (cytosine-5-)-methyltransferase [Gammaproteobacteria bacterium]|nr:MAG: DNA (cytosine-5-)-methyltransferase [Gammaproteobacteria bacterium]